MDLCIVQDLDLRLEEPGDDDAEAHPQEVMKFEEQVEGHHGHQDAPNNVAYQHHVVRRTATTNQFSVCPNSEFSPLRYFKTLASLSLNIVILKPNLYRVNFSHTNFDLMYILTSSNYL